MHCPVINGRAATPSGNRLLKITRGGESPGKSPKTSIKIFPFSEEEILGRRYPLLYKPR
jgi:hypothetical protein